MWKHWKQIDFKGIVWQKRYNLEENFRKIDDSRTFNLCFKILKSTSWGPFIKDVQFIRGRVSEKKTENLDTYCYFQWNSIVSVGHTGEGKLQTTIVFFCTNVCTTRHSGRDWRGGLKILNLARRPLYGWSMW